MGGGGGGYALEFFFFFFLGGGGVRLGSANTGPISESIPVLRLSDQNS